MTNGVQEMTVTVNYMVITVTLRHAVWTRSYWLSRKINIHSFTFM